MERTALVVGGTSGLGLAMARGYAKQRLRVFIAGRHDPKAEGLRFVRLNLSEWALTRSKVDRFLKDLPVIDLLVYAAGMLEKKPLRELRWDEAEDLMNLGFRAPLMLVYCLLKRQSALPKLIFITSTSQIQPRPDEVIYTGTKAGIAMAMQSLAMGESRIGKVLVPAPAGMNTPMRTDLSNEEREKLLDPADVAKAIMQVDAETEWKYNNFLILRDPMRIETITAW